MGDLTARMGNPEYMPAHQRVSQSTFLGVLWLFTGLSAIFMIGRLGIRFKTFRRFGLDDFLAVLAWVILLTYSITWQIKAHLMYWQFDVSEGKLPATPQWLEAWATFMPFVAAWNILFYCCLWSVKFSFLVFFRKLDAIVKAHRAWWWVVFAVTFAGLIASIADVDYACSLRSIYFITAECVRADQVRFNARTLYANLAADLVSDILILSVPISQLWNVQIPRRRKFVLYGIFSATIVIMIVAIIRSVLIKPNISSKQNASLDWLYLWSAVEMGVAIMISCVASFRQLFVSQNNQHLYRSTLPTPRAQLRGGTAGTEEQEYSQISISLSHHGKPSLQSSEHQA